MSLFASYLLPCLTRLALGKFFASQSFAHQFVGEHQLGLVHVLNRNQDLGFLAFSCVDAAKARSLSLSPDQYAAETLAALNRHSSFDLGEMTRVTFEIRYAHQRTVDAG